MEQADTLTRLYGTDEPVQDLRQVDAGPLSLLYSQDGLRRISWHGVELVRALAWPMRDENWGTYPAEILGETIDDSDGFAANLTFAVGGGRLICEVGIRALAVGVVQADITMTPKGGPFATNRSGFTVLHPIKGVAGAPLDVAKADGSNDATTFPRHIQPDQPVKDIAGLSYGLEGRSVVIEFGGEIFEMEDQRNWSDASYKTYCVPLVHPFTYDITEPTRQSVRMTFTGDGGAAAVGGASGPMQVAPSEATTPAIGLALDTGWAPAVALTPALDFSHVLLRTAPGASDLRKLAAFARSFGAVDVEIVLPDDMPVEAGLKKMAEALAAERIKPRRVIALREGYLGSHQPVGPWPEGPTPNEMLAAVRAAFPQAAVGGGMMTNFTEMNRCRPDVARCDYVTHGLTPLVHAGDDMSVLETLETLPQIFGSTEAMSGGRPYWLGLCSLGMRSNPYGADIAHNPKQVRRTMARIDPRHRGLFAAAYAVGVLAATEGSAVEGLCLGAPTGPFGLVYAPADYPQLGYDGEDRSVYPLYHVARAASALAGQPRLAMQGLPEGVAGFGASIGGKNRLLLANVTTEQKQVALDAQATVLRLDAESFDAATRSADWLSDAGGVQTSVAELPPFAVAFVELNPKQD